MAEINPRRDVQLTGGDAGKLADIHASLAGTINVGGNTFQATAAVTRTADTTQYTINKIVGNASALSALLELKHPGPAAFFLGNGKSATVLKARLDISGSTSLTAAHGGIIRAHLFKAVPTGLTLTDAQTMLMLSANRDIKVGYIDFLTWNVGAATSDCISAMGVLCATPDKMIAADDAAVLYVVLEHTTAPTAANSISAAVYKLYVWGEHDA